MGGGDFSMYKTQDFKSKIEELLKLNNLNNFIKEQTRLFDGHSPNRFLKLINDTLVSFRKATIKDMLSVYNWSNDILVRQNSYNSAPITLANHKEWYQQKMKNKNTLFLIACFDNQPAGIVRYEISKDYAVIGVLVVENFRGRMLSSSFLSESAKEYFRQYKLPVFAYIKENNKASIKAFERAGYTYLKKDIINNIHSYIYKFEKNDLE